MAAITSNGTGGGDWSSTSSWSGGTVPGDGDTVTIDVGDVITVTDTRTVGTSGASATEAIGIAGQGSQLDINGGTLNLRGNLKVNGSNTFATHIYLRIRGGGTLNFDTSAASTPATTRYGVDTGSAHFQYAKASFEGTSGSRVTVKTDGSGLNAYFLNGGFLDSNYVDADYCDFIRVGDNSVEGFLPSLRDNVEAVFDFNECTFDDCGQHNWGIPGAAATVKYVNCTFFNTTDGYCIMSGAGGSTPTGAREITGCVFDKRCRLYAAQGMTFGAENAFLGGIETTGSSAWASWHMDSIVIEATNQDVVGLPEGADMKAVLINDYGGGDPHFINCLVSGGAVASSDIHDCIFWLNGTAGPAGNGILTPSPGGANDWTINVRRVIVLPDNAGNGSSNLLHQFSTTVRAPCDVQYCTVRWHGDGGGLLNPVNDTARCTALKNNICWDSATSASNLFVNSTGAATAGDSISGGDGNNWDYNASFNPHTTLYDTALSFTNAPGANDFEADPTFVDSTRTPLTWDSANGGAGTLASLKTEVNKKNRPSADANYLPSALQAYIRAGFAPTNATYQNSDLAGTASVGAVDYQAPAGGGSGVGRGVSNDVARDPSHAAAFDVAY